MLDIQVSVQGWKVLRADVDSPVCEKELSLPIWNTIAELSAISVGGGCNCERATKATNIWHDIS